MVLEDAWRGNSDDDDYEHMNYVVVFSLLKVVGFFLTQSREIEFCVLADLEIAVIFELWTFFFEMKHCGKCFFVKFLLCLCFVRVNGGGFSRASSSASSIIVFCYLKKYFFFAIT